MGKLKVGQRVIIRELSQFMGGKEALRIHIPSSMLQTSNTICVIQRSLYKHGSYRYRCKNGYWYSPKWIEPYCGKSINKLL